MLDSINFKQPTVGEDQGSEFMIRNPELLNSDKLQTMEETVEECRNLAHATVLKLVLGF